VAGLADLPAIRVTESLEQAKRGGYYGTRVLYDASKLVDIARGTLVKALQAEGVKCDTERYRLLHLTPYYGNRQRAYDGYPAPVVSAEFPTEPYAPGDLPVAEKFHAQLLALPVLTELRHPLIDQIIEAFHKVMSPTNVEELKDAEESGDPVLFDSVV